MRQIQPVNILVQGTYVPATYFDVECLFDDLKTKAKFRYSYISATPDNNPEGSIIYQVLQSEKIIMEGQDYVNWGNSGDINNDAIVWVADQVNVVLIN